MWRWRRFLAKFLNLFRHAHAEEEIAREIASHLALMEDEFQRRGMSPAEARLAAKREYGGIERVKELHRQERSFPWLEQSLRDLNYASRNLARNPGFTVVVVLTLALGIGVNTTLFSAYDAVALKPLPISDPDKVFRLERWFERGYRGDVQYAFSYPEYAYCRDHNEVFSSVVAASWPHQALVEASGLQSQTASIELVSSNYFTGLGISPHLGRTFLPEEDRTPGANAIAVISYPFWQRQFHQDPQVLGRIIKINGIAFTIVGVTPEKFTGTSTLPQVPDFWVPLSMQAQLVPRSDWLHEPDNLKLQILARLKPSTTARRAQEETNSLILQFATTFRSREKTLAITLQRTAFFGNTDDIRFQALIAALMLVVASVLAVACANVANMLLARGAARYREIGIRLALGASRGRIMRQLLSESILLSLLGGAGGLLASLWTTKLLWVSIQQIFAGLFHSSAVFKLDLSADARIFAYAFAISVLTGIFFGLSPALQFSKPDLTATLKAEGTPLNQPWNRSRIRGFLIAAQTGVSMVLLIATGLLLRGIMRSQAADPGFETHKIVLLQADLGSDLAKSIALERRLVDRLQTAPGITSAALGTVPLLGTWTAPIIIEGKFNSQPRSVDRALAGYASDTYFDTLGIPLLRGRGFSKREAISGAHVAVISEATARRFWPNENPLGKQFKLGSYFKRSFIEFEVIGIAKDVRFANLSRIDPARVYLPTGTDQLYGILLRTQGDPQSAMASIRIAVGRIDKNLLPGLSIMSLEKGPLHVQKSMAQICAAYAGILALLALALAGVGIYGVMAYLVSQRVREIGIRMALGARAPDIVKTIVIEGLRPAFIGVTLGVAGAMALSWTVHTTLAFPGSADFFYGVPFYDPATFLGLACFFILITAIASFVPAWRAVRVDPLVALRYE